jgi:nucleoside-diphosphate-sugar epimerase
MTVVGADGFVGGALARALETHRIVYGSCGKEDVHISECRELLGQSDVVINAAGFRVRTGCNYKEYRRSHQGATAELLPKLRQGALLVHISSASVYGRSKTEKLGLNTPPNPEAFPCPAYATAKWETDQFLERAAADYGIKVIFLRPAVVYSPQGAGMIDTLVKLAKRGITLRLYPRGARHHLCHTALLAEVARRVIEQQDRLPHLSRFIVADPTTVTNCELERLLHRYMGKKTVTIPIPLGLVTRLLSQSFSSRRPKFDLKTRGEIFGVLNLGSVYDPSDTYRILGIDPARYTMDKTLESLIQQALQ